MDDETKMPTDGLNSEADVQTDAESGGNDLTVDEILEAYHQEREARLKAEELANNYKVRAEKAEKAPKHDPSLQTNTGTLKQEDVEILILKRDGLSEDEISLAREIAAIQKVSLLEATKSKLFIAQKKISEDENKSAKAQLSSSRRGQSYERPQTIEEISKDRDSHMKFFKQATSQ